MATVHTRAKVDEIGDAAVGGGGAPVTTLKSTAFRAEREPAWRRLEALITRAETGGLASLDARELLRLPILYRAVLSSLSVARAISLDRNLLTYLESLSSRAYFLVYGGRSNALSAIGRFLAVTLPAAVRAARWYIALSALCMVLGALVGYVLTIGNLDWFYTFVSEGSAQGRTPTADTETLRRPLFSDGRGLSERLTAFASFLFTHNARIGIMAFALGFALGAPTVLLLFFNGLTLGAFAALYTSRGLGTELWGWLLIHGVTELTAIVLCGAAGLMLGRAVIFPGEYTRLQNLARAGRRAGVIVIGAVLMFFVAALLEGFGRQLILQTDQRFLVAGVTAVLWGLYFVRSGRGAS
ncbi:MAG: stage II sporulation protein M [Alphaproteobacteria bacterium]|nr:stage II sporulation protein M [Alphaproteobacteria bacterium]